VQKMIDSRVLADAMDAAATMIGCDAVCRLVASEAAGGVPVIGYRTTVYPIPVMVWRMTCLPSHYACEVKPGEPVALGDVITLEAADALLAAELEIACGHVADMVANETLSVQQVAALISFVHDLGPASFASSHLLAYLNLLDVEAACDELQRWTLVWTGSELREDAARMRWREIERELLDDGHGAL
jgi:GH24 family phage-related lysozyme (muramidase)